MTAMASPGVALVTGAGKRIGKAIAFALADAGYDLIVHHNSSAREAENVASAIQDKGRRAVALQTNLSSEKETASLIAAATDALGPLSLLVNSASVFERDDAETMTRKSWDLHLDTNLRAPLKLIQDFAAQKKSSGNRSVVNIIDQRVLKLTPQFFSYTLSKSALYTATYTLAQTLGPKGIRVNAIGPGPVIKNARQSDEDWEMQNGATILGSGATPDDISQAVLYLAQATSVTGQMIAVDGGQHLVWQTPDVMVNE